MRLKGILFFLLLSALIPIPLVKADPGWLTGWEYRKSLTIIGSTDGTQTNYQVGIFVYKGNGVDGNITKGNTVFGKVYSETHCQDNFGDIRFTKADETTELDYWIEYVSSGSYAIFWAEVDAIPDSPSTVKIYIYYGTEEATTTTSNMENTWTDSLDWTSDLTGSFTKYEPAGGIIDLEDTWLTSTDAEYPCRVISKRSITDAWVADNLGTTSKNVLNEVADDWRDSIGTITGAAISDDFGTGANTTHAGHILYSAGLYDIKLFTVQLDYWFINDIIVVAETSADSDWMSEGRGTVHMQESVADAPAALNYWGYSYGAGSGIQLETFSYDGTNDVIEWGCRYGAAYGEHYEKSPWMVIGKYTTNEPTFGEWGEEEEPPIVEAPIKLFGAGFNASAPYVILRWASNLTDISFFEVQNSTDKTSWDYLGQSTTNQYTDLQVINGLERFYRIRACNFTGGAWYNSTFTDINFEKVYFVSGDGLFPGLAIGISLLIIGAAYLVEKRR